MIKTKQELLNHFSDINEMYNNPFMYQTLSNMIDELLEQQPCDDCISRQAVLDYIEGSGAELGHDSENELVCQDIKALPSVTPQQTMWIPCSERLPKENEYIGDVCKYYLVQDENGDMHVAHLSNVGWIPMDSLKAIGDEVIAWRELPQPYKSESEDKK